MNVLMIGLDSMLTRERGQITGLSLTDAQELSRLLNASIASSPR
jgi:hypothetical protein